MRELTEFFFFAKIGRRHIRKRKEVLHGQGIQDEMDSFVEFLEEEKRDDVYRWLADGEAEIKKKFMRL